MDIFVQNKALLLKNLHKFYNRHNIPWVNLIWEPITILVCCLAVVGLDLFGGRQTLS